jgi:hypothetical protein
MSAPLRAGADAPVDVPGVRVRGRSLERERDRGSREEREHENGEDDSCLA